MEEIRASLPANTDIEIWWQDEARVGQKTKLTRRWAARGSRPIALKDQRTKSVYIFGAICPERGVGAALVLPRCNTEAMQWHLNEISSQVTPCAHAILIVDRAGWHTTKKLIGGILSRFPLPSHHQFKFFTSRGKPVDEDFDAVLDLHWRGIQTPAS